MAKEKTELNLVVTQGGVYLNGLRENSKGQNPWKDKLTNPDVGAKETKTGNLKLPAHIKNFAQGVEFVEKNIGDALYKYASLVEKSADEVKETKSAPPKQKQNRYTNSFEFTKVGNDVKMTNPDFVEDYRLKNSYKQIVKDAGITMSWSRKDGAFIAKDTDIKTMVGFIAKAEEIAKKQNKSDAKVAEGITLKSLAAKVEKLDKKISAIQKQ